jgi:hypothetical protein
MEVHTSSLNRGLFFMTLIAFLSACDSTGPEPVEIGHYFIDNRTKLTLQLEIDNALWEDEVPPDSIFHFYTIEVGSGGSAAPYQIFSQFNVTAKIDNMDSSLYNGIYVDDWEDWKIRNTRIIEEKPGKEYYLTIPR